MMDDEAVARPRFKAGVEPIIDPDDGLFLLSESGHEWYSDEIYAAVAPFLDGTHDIEAIFAALSDTFEISDVFDALDELRSSGYLSDDASQGARWAAAFWEKAGVRPSDARSRLSSTPVSVLSFGGVDAGALVELLRLNGVCVGSEGALSVVVTDDYLRPELETWNASALSTGIPWLVAKPVGVETWVGPLFSPNKTACWACLAQRLRGHRRLEEYVARRSKRALPIGPPPSSLPSTTCAAFADVATEVTRWITSGGSSNATDRVVSTNMLTLERRTHVVTRRPQCPACGPSVSEIAVDTRPIELRSRRKVFTTGGGHRISDPRDLIARLDRHVSPISGIVSTLDAGVRSRSEHGTDVTPTFSADHNFSDMHDARFFLRDGLRRRSGGKGTTIDQARASALAESIERYSGVFDGTEPRMRASLNALGDAAIHPNACMRFSETQYAERESYNKRAHKAYWVPEPFCADAQIEWSPLQSLTHGRTRYLPTSYCYFGYSSADSIMARADSNGCAAGAVLEEAVLQGALELIERDAVAIWWYNRLKRPGVDLASFDDRYISALLDRYAELRREIWALDVTSDLGVPTFAAISRRVDQPEQDIIYGFGAHLDPRVALIRALTEVNQSLEAVPVAAGPASHRTYLADSDAIRWWRHTTVEDDAYLAPDPAVAPRRCTSFRELASDDLHQDILTCTALAAASGIELLVLDQTRPDVGLPVVRVVAPGLRHFWARYGPGRLYDVPVKLGWFPEPLTESELNHSVIQF